MIAERLAEYGLCLRGGFNFSRDEEAPPALSGRPAKAVLLVGNLGAAAFWPCFERWRDGQEMRAENPLDTWSRSVAEAVGRDCGARVVMPNDRPFLPFQQWAIRAEGLRPSPMGILMHPQYGLWHAYRAGLLFDEPMSLKDVSQGEHPCDLCESKPCLTSCPVDAHDAGGFKYGRCLSHIRSAAGEPCRRFGCFDRNACPVGVQYRYPPAMQQFLMKAFAA